MTESTIVLEGVDKRYGDIQALDDVTLSVDAGQCVALLGPNGAGKTTLMKLLLGLTAPSGGTVRVLGQAPGGGAGVETRREIGFLPENVRFHEAMTGRETLTFYARLKGVLPSRIEALFERVGLADAAGRRVKTYSKGMRQRLGLAQALLGTPRLLLLDEPTSGLDPLLRQSFYGIIHDLAEAGNTIFLSSHALTELEARTDRVAIMRQGRVVADGSMASLRRAAGLPVRIRVAVSSQERDTVLAGDFGGGTTAAPFNGQTLELTCQESSKVEVVRRIAQLGCPIEDIEILPPTLDEIYAFYGTTGEQP